jgi:hypothetical protein
MPLTPGEIIVQFQEDGTVVLWNGNNGVTVLSPSDPAPVGMDPVTLFYPTGSTTPLDTTIGALETDIATIEERLEEASFNVQAYGAVGDGVTDDTAAIAAAIAVVDAAGGVVYFPPGTYLTSAQINIFGANVTMRGAGPSTIIKAKNAANVGVMFWVQSTASNFTAEAFVLDGNRDNLGTSGSYAGCLGFMCYESDGVLFRDVEVKNVNSIGIGVESPTAWHDARATFERCWIHHNGMLTAKEGNDVFLYNVSNCKFTDCLFEHGYGTGGGGLYAGGGVVGSYIETTFVNCTFRDNFNGGGQTGGQGYPDLDNRWSYIGCVFELTEADPHATCGIEGSDRGLLVDGCEFYGHTGSTGGAIAFHGDFGTPTDEAGWLIVTNCVFVNNFYAITQTNTGDVSHILIANNRFEGGATGVMLGLEVGSPASDVIIANNDFASTITTPITAPFVTNLVQVGNLPATIGNTVLGTTTHTGDLHLGVNPASTAFGTLGLPNGIHGAIVFRNAANDADYTSVHLGGNNRLYLMNTHNIGASDVDISGSLYASSHLQIGDGISAPGTTSGRASIYVDTADGDLKIKYGDGVVKTIVVDT